MSDTPDTGKVTPALKAEILAEALPYIFDLLEYEGLCLGGSSAINIAGAVRMAVVAGPHAGKAGRDPRQGIGAAANQQHARSGPGQRQRGRAAHARTRPRHHCRLAGKSQSAHFAKLSL